MTYVELLYEFVSNATGQPLRIGRTFLTYYDLDAGPQSSSELGDTAKLGDDRNAPPFRRTASPAAHPSHS